MLRRTDGPVLGYSVSFTYIYIPEWDNDPRSYLSMAVFKSVRVNNKILASQFSVFVCYYLGLYILSVLNLVGRQAGVDKWEFEFPVWDCWFIHFCLPRWPD